MRICRMSLITTLPLVVDRIRITGIELSSEQFGCALSQLPEIAVLCSEKIKIGVVSLHKPSPYVTAINYSLGKNVVVARLEVGSTKMQKKYLAWELRPHHIVGSDVYEFHRYIWLLLVDFVGKAFAYESSFLKGKVQYIELASDELTQKMHTFVPWADYIRESTIYIKNGVKGTIYLGGMQSQRAYSIYDKEKERMEKGFPQEYFIRTRIEAKFRKTHLHPWELIGISNPFESLHMADLKFARKFTKDAKFQGFLDAAVTHGSPTAFKALTTAERAKVKSLLKLCSAKWWNPATIWKTYPQALEKLYPSFVYGSEMV